jgi:hypothetical protein
VTMPLSHFCSFLLSMIEHVAPKSYYIGSIKGNDDAAAPKSCVCSLLWPPQANSVMPDTEWGLRLIVVWPATGKLNGRSYTDIDQLSKDPSCVCHVTLYPNWQMLIMTPLVSQWQARPFRRLLPRCSQCCILRITRLIM